MHVVVVHVTRTNALMRTNPCCGDGAKWTPKAPFVPRWASGAGRGLYMAIDVVVLCFAVCAMASSQPEAPPLSTCTPMALFARHCWAETTATQQQHST